MTQKEMNKSDLAIWIADAMKESDGISIPWRAILKFMDDWESDNDLKIEIKEKPIICIKCGKPIDKKEIPKEYFQKIGLQSIWHEVCPE